MKKALDHTGLCVVYFCHDGKGNVLMNLRSKNTRDEQGTWDFGGGSLEFGELLEDALRRELMEEYNAEPLEFEPLGFREVHRTLEDGSKTHWIAFDYKVLLDPKKVTNAEPHHHDEIRWFKPSKLPSPVHSQLHVFLEKYKSQL